MAGDRGGGEVELVEGLGDRERGGLEPGAGVGGVAGGDLGLDQGAQELLGGPALGLGGEQQLGGEAAHRGQLQPAQPVVQVGRQRRWGRGHDGLPITVSSVSVVDPVGGAAEGVGGQGAGRDPGQVEHQGVPGRVGCGVPGAGGEDGADVGGAPPAERHRPVQGGEQGLVAVRGAQSEQLVQLRPSRVLPAAAAPARNASATGPERAERLLRHGLRATARRGAGRGPS